MALTLAERDALCTNDVFLGRVRCAVRCHASAILNQKEIDSKRMDWAASVFWAGKSACRIAAEMAGELSVRDAIVEAKTIDASDIADDTFLKAVGEICEKYS